MNEMNSRAPFYFSQDDCRKLAQELADALLTEFRCKRSLRVAETQAIAATVEAAVIEQAMADGKNPDTTKAQRDTTLDIIAMAEERATIAEIERKRVEAVVELTKAWLHSQSGG